MKVTIFLMEAGSNSFEVHRRLVERGLKACVLESAHVGKHAKSYADNDKIASLRIAMVFLGTKAPCVWVPDSLTLERRELLHAHQRAVREHRRSTNSLKGYLNQFGIRLKKRLPHQESTHDWVLKKRDWSSLQKEILQSHFIDVGHAHKKRKSFNRIICSQVLGEPIMLKLMSLLGIGIINAFALIAIIGDIRRFENAKKLVAYLGLNPGSRESGSSKRVRVGIGKRGRKEMRNLLVQAAQSVLRRGKVTAIGEWGMKLFLRKGKRNIAVGAVARKLVVQIWHLLMGNSPTAHSRQPLA